MTEERDAKVSAAYRGLGAEEPPRALDEAILAAARRDADARPALLAARADRLRWYAPLATAAVLVLAVAVTLNMQTERPGIESAVPRTSAPPPAAARDAAKAREKENREIAKLEVADAASAEKAPIARRKTAAPAVAADTRVARSKDDAPAAAPAAPPAASEPKPFMAERPAVTGSVSSEAARNVAPSAAGPLSQSAPAEALAKRAESADRADRGAASAPAAAPARMQQKVADTPERELERIAELRAQGRHEDADKALAEFRKRNPDYKIPEPMRARVERR